MRFFVLSVLACLVQFTAQAQLVITPTRLTFGTNQQAGALDSLLMTVTNTGADSTYVNSYIQYIYATNAASPSPELESIFYMGANGVFSTYMRPGEVRTFYVYFRPLQNISYSSHLIISSTRPAGATAIPWTGTGRFSPYYASTQDLSEDQLRVALKTLTGQGYRSLGYDGGRDKMFMEIDNERVNGQGAAQNQLTCIYTGRQIIGYTSRQVAQNATNNFNTEHTFPQGFFGQDEPMRSDLHHLFPTDAPANNRRDNDPFNLVPSPVWEVGGSKWAGNVFEPRTPQKGATARAMAYFVTRYQDYTNFFAPQEPILRQWIQSFPPTAQEKTRNNLVQTAQGNRNPFVDYPQFLTRITKLVGPTAPRQIRNILVYPNGITLRRVMQGDSVKIPVAKVNFGNVSINVSLSTDTRADGWRLHTPRQQVGINEVGVDTLVFTATTPGSRQGSVNYVEALGASVLPLNSTGYTVDVITSNRRPVTKVRLHPQPANGAVQLTATAGLLEACLYTTTGQRVRCQALSGHEASFSLEGVARGMYILRLSTTAGPQELRLVRE